MTCRLVIGNVLYLPVTCKQTIAPGSGTHVAEWQESKSLSLDHMPQMSSLAYIPGTRLLAQTIAQLP